MKIKQLAGVAVGLALLAAACGDDGAETTSSPTEATDESSPEATEPDGTVPESTVPESTVPAATTAPVTETTAPAADVPVAIVSLSPTATEMLYAIGAGDEVLAVDDFSNYPPEAAEKMQGLSGFQPNVEAIAGLEPDLVITDGTNPDLLDQLDTLGIPHWEGPAAVGFDDVYAQIEQLGAATGHVAEAAALIADMQAEVEAVQADLPELDEPLTYYHELDGTYFSVTSDTFIGAVYDEVGLVNIADEAGLDTPFPQLNAEFIIEQDPDLVFLACTIYCGITADSVGERPGWGDMAAVRSGGVVEMDDDVASRWGPRIVDYLRVVGESVAEVQAAKVG